MVVWDWKSELLSSHLNNFVYVFAKRYDRMKMPWRWRTSRIVHLIVLSPDCCHWLLSFNDAMWRYPVTSHDIMASHQRSGFCIRSPKLEKPGKSCFDLMTLTYDLNHPTWPRFHQGQSLYHVLCPYIKWLGSESANELTDRRDRFYYLHASLAHDSLFVDWFGHLCHPFIGLWQAASSRTTSLVW